MSEIYTHNLIRFYYNETSASETAGINELLSANGSVKAEFEDMTELLNTLQEAELDAHPTSISLILEYSQKQEVHHV